MAHANYTDLFQARGNKYDTAMQQFPHARDEEFMLAVNKASFTKTTRVMDVPAGGGYLKKYLPKHCQYFPYEPCLNFVDSDNSLPANLLPLPFDTHKGDVVISIAGIHHQEDKLAFFDEIHRVLKMGGQFILADVYKDSAVAMFLDYFIGLHNSTGHEGLYVDENTVQLLSSNGFNIQSAERTPFHWLFNDTNEMADFCRLLFDLRDISSDEILTAVDQTLGIKTFTEGVAMNWELFYIDSTTKRRP
jgi:SAM-dependent methyltransferase